MAVGDYDKRRDGYEVRWRTIDGASRRRLCPTLRSARKLDLAIKEAKAEGRDWKPESSTAEPTVLDLAEAFQDARRLRFRPDTLRSEARSLDVFMRFLGERSPHPATSGDLSRPLLDEFHAWLARPDTGLHKRPRKPQTIANVIGTIEQLWKWADESERWPEQIPRPRSIERPQSQRSPVVSPTWAEMDACVGAVLGWQKRLAIWLRYTGLRTNESMLLLWSDLDLARGTLTLRPEIEKMPTGRTIPLSPHLLNEISTWGVREGYVIPSTKRSKEYPREARSREMAAGWAAAGVREIVWKQRPDHAFRRGFKTGLLSLGANPDAVDYLQGHTLGESSRGRYIDPWHALPLVAVVELVPKIGETGGNVVALRGTGK